MCGRCLMSKLPSWANNQGVRRRIREQNLDSQMWSPRKQADLQGTVCPVGNAKPQRAAKETA